MDSSLSYSLLYFPLKATYLYGVEEKIRIVLEGLRGEHTRGRPYHPQTQGKIER